MIDIDQDTLIKAVARAIMDDMVHADMVEAIKREIRTEIVASVRTEVSDLVGVWVEERLTGTFQPTNRWGEPRGEPVTIRELAMAEVEQRCNRKVSPHSGRDADRHDRGSITAVHYMAREAIKETVDERVKALTEAAVNDAMERLTEEDVGRSVKSAVWSALRPKK